MLLVGESRSFALPLVEFLLKPRDSGESDVPSTFEFTRNQSVFRINRIVLSLSTLSFIACLLQRQFQRLLFLDVLIGCLVNGSQCRLDANWLNSLEHLLDDSSFYVHAAQRQA